MEDLKALLYNQDPNLVELGHVTLGFGIAKALDFRLTEDGKLDKLTILDSLRNTLLYQPDKANHYAELISKYNNRVIGQPGIDFLDFLGVREYFSNDLIDLINSNFNMFYKAYLDAVNCVGG